MRKAREAGGLSLLRSLRTLSISSDHVALTEYEVHAGGCTKSPSHNRILLYLDFMQEELKDVMTMHKPLK